ncbi:RNA recognition motif family protein [Theileria parva strain Muguga]|uniref:RNA recognition motif family protein n=1 Tax=Theileria parva strain Muguga TaxID=333668 RepID=UPI001C624771|nr:RNA recognition motif family protein [Theileria parva strain Muguga]EAN31411.2 RNA recognition motif family protein [Theileria parva strain Muguga]
MNRSNKRRVYVGNLSWKVRWQDLKDHMKQVGDVLRADIIEDYDGKSKGCGIVEFADEDSASRAIAELNDTMILDRQIFVREDRENYNTFRGYGRFFRLRPRIDSPSGYSGRSSGRSGTSVIVTNLQWKTSWKELKDLFKSCGLVLRADVLTHEDGRSKGVGKVVFANEYSARKAITMYNDYVLDGRKIGVRLEN